jgi:hypothetical protein
MRKKYLWSTVDAGRKLVPFAIFEVDSRLARELEDRRRQDRLWKFIADMLEGRRVGDEKIPSYYDEYGRRRLFWYNNVLEDYEEAYERLIEETIEELTKFIAYDDDEALLTDAEMRVEEKLSELPVIRL